MPNAIINDPKREVFTREDIENFVHNEVHPLRDRALIAILYLTNSRVSEIVKKLRKKDIKLITEYDNNFFIFTLTTLKNRKHPSRNIPVLISKEKKLVEVVAQYMGLFQNDDILFDFSRVSAWSIVKKITGQRCHFLRHTRLTHLASEYGFSDTTLKNMAGWSDGRPGDTYIHLNWKDTAKLMIPFKRGLKDDIT